MFFCFMDSSLPQIISALDFKVTFKILSTSRTVKVTRVLTSADFTGEQAFLFPYIVNELQ